MTLPQEFSQAFENQFGAQHLQAYILSLESPPPVSLRMNPHKWKEPLNLERIPWTDTGYYLPQRPLFTADPLFHAGLYYVQEASSMILERAFRQLDLPGPLRVLDLCAAPGGKSTHLLSLLGEEDLLVSNEVIQSRASILRENLIKWGLSNVIITQNDPKDFGRLPGFFDLLVVDAPCSGEGLFRKDPQAIGEWSPANVHLCYQRQQRIIADAWECLSEDGVLIYSTCTYNQDENEGVLDWLCRTFEVEPVNLKFLESWQLHVYNRRAFQGFKLIPGRVKGEGYSFFVVRKKGGQPRKGALKLKQRIKPSEVARDWLFDERLEVYEKGEDLVATRFSEESLFLDSHLRCSRSGLTVGQVKKNKVVPSHELAMSVDLKRDVFPAIPLNDIQALLFLRNETFELPSGTEGYHLLTFEGHPLGWINHLGHRWNNLYPKKWRILRDFTDRSFSLHPLRSGQ